MKRLFVMMSGALLVGMLADGTAADRTYAYTDGLPESACWVGQQVVFSVVIGMDERPQGSPRFTYPDVPGGMLLEVSGRPTYSKEEKEGIEYTTWRYDLAFYPQRAGSHTIPPITVRPSLPLGDGTWQAFPAQTEPFSIDAKLPEGAEGLASLVATKRFEANETWTPEISTPKVGDAITRTIVRKADDILGHGFPPLGLTEIDGVGIYPELPVVKDQAYRGDISGERTETVVYSFEQEGAVTIPGHVIPWFDLGSEQMQYVRFPARQIEVAPNPALFASLETEVARRRAIPWKFIGGMVGLLGVALVLVRRYGRELMEAVRRQCERRQASEGVAFKGLLDACQRQEAAVVSQAAREWVQRLYERQHPVPIDQFLTEVGDSDLTEQVKRLNAGLFASGSKSEWDPQVMHTALIRARKYWHHRQLGHSTQRNTLSPLNPAI